MSRSRFAPRAKRYTASADAGIPLTLARINDVAAYILFLE